MQNLMQIITPVLSLTSTIGLISLTLCLHLSCEPCIITLRRIMELIESSTSRLDCSSTRVEAEVWTKIGAVMEPMKDHAVTTLSLRVAATWLWHGSSTGSSFIVAMISRTLAIAGHILRFTDQVTRESSVIFTLRDCMRVDLRLSSSPQRDCVLADTSFGMSLEPGTVLFSNM